LGLAAAFVFAAQMINFPVPGATSGHLLGGVLAAALLGPSAAVIVISTVLIVQCLAFADGGITTLGANIFNMGLVGAVGGWAIYAGLARLTGRWGMAGRLFAAIVAAWCSTMLAAVVCAGELATSHAALTTTVFPAMASVHMFIGLGEGVITALVLSSIASVRPELVTPAANGEAARALPLWPVLVYGLLVTLGLAFFVFPFASQAPDGLEAVAERLGLAARQQDHAALLWTNYTAWAAAAAIVFIFAAGWFLARLLTARRAAD
jgi:cobalt/nickel transport system permease protein